MQKKDVMSTQTTNQDIANLALVLFDNADYLMRSITSANVLAKYRAKLSRMALKMQREAMNLGCLEPANSKAFVSLSATKQFVQQLN